MKNVLRLTTLALVLVMMLGALVSCGAPNADPEKAEEALEDAGYEVSVDSKLAPAAYKAMGVDGVDCVLSAINLDEDEEGILFVVYFDEAADAKEAFEDIKKDAEEEMEDEEDFVCKRSGKMIYYGTKNAVKAAK